MICHLQAEKPGKVVMEFSLGLITGKQGYLSLKARESGAPVLKGRRRLDITAQAEKEFILPPLPSIQALEGSDYAS